MSDSPPHNKGDGVPSPPTNEHGGIDAQTLRDLVQTEEGAATLAEALKDRRVRDVLKQHGVRIQTDKDVGYHSLPLELRDKVQKCAIAVLNPDRPFPVSKCSLCPRLAPYACIDSEWRHAVESITFGSLTLSLSKRNDGGSMKELELFECYVVGSRRKYLHRICLPVRSILGLDGDTEAHTGEGKRDSLVSPIHRIFNCVKHWPENGTTNGRLGVEIDSIPWNDNSTITMDRVQGTLHDLPTVPQITHLCVPLWLPINVRSMLALVSRMPNLQSAITVLDYTELPASETSFDIQLLFENLSQTAPKLESLEIKYDSWWYQRDVHTAFCTAALSFSQKLLKFSVLTKPTRGGSPMFKTILAPFFTSNFSPYAPPPLVWPNLTHFKIEKWHVISTQGGRAGMVRELNELMSAVGRMVRCMPRLQNLEILVAYPADFSGIGVPGSGVCTEIAFSLESFKGCSPQATLSITHNSDEVDIAETVPSAEVRKLWKQSLLESSNTSLEVQVISRGSAYAVWDELGFIP